MNERLGRVKILVMENKDRQGDDDPSHILYLTEAPDRRQERGDRARVPTASRTPQTASDDRRRTFQAQAPLDRDDPPPPEWAR